MKKTVSLTRNTKIEITEKWHQLFPSMGIYKNMWLMNICGPLAIGIHLHVGSDNTKYTPQLHVHNLSCQSKGVVYLDLLIENRDPGYWSISTTSKPEKYIDFAQRLQEKSFVSIDDEINLRELIECLKKIFYEQWYHDRVLEIITYLAYWSGVPEIIANAREFGNEALNWLTTGSESMKYANPQIFNIKYKELLDKLEHEMDLQRTVEEQIVELKMTNLPRRKMIY